MTNKSAESCHAISVVEADASLKSLASFDVVLLAVSGGADSMAMLELVAEWRERRRAVQAMPTSHIFVVTVDHGLRADSADEACFVAARSRALGLSHATLHWSGGKPKTGLANAARDARYRLLQAHVETLANGRSCVVVTAHTRDDQAETVLMRLARGSGCDGLSAMSPGRLMAKGSKSYLLRPLLNFSKSRLVATLTARHLTWRDDPSNCDDAYERVRVRCAMPTLEAAGLTSAALARTARRMQATRDALTFADQAFVDSLGLSFNDEVFASFECAAFERAPILLRGRLLARLIHRYGGASAAPDLQDVEHLVEEFASVKQTRMTLGGVVISKGQRRVRLWREPGRLTAKDQSMPHGSSTLWDGRFWLNRSGGQTEVSVFVRPLGMVGYSQIVKSLRTHKSLLPAGAVQALPAFYSEETLISVPSLAYYAPKLANHAKFTGLELTAKAAFEA